MRGPGRKSKPTALKLVTGNPGKRPLNANEPIPTQAPAPPTPPRHLTKEARAEWARVCRELWLLGLLSSLDTSLLAAYCDSFATWVEARRAIEAVRKEEQRLDRLHAKRIAAGQEIADHEKNLSAFGGLLTYTSNGNVIQNPLIGIMNKAKVDMIRFAAEIGMTPAARSRINVSKAEANADPAGKFFGRSKSA